MKPLVTILPSHKIDTIKWDNCVAKNKEGLVYATTNYLNFMADNWSGLVVDDYAAIMPLPWKRKLGIRYLYTPPFAQQLGFIGTTHIDAAQLQHALQGFVKYGDYLFNYKNTNFGETYNFSHRSNYIINLNQIYATIKSGYSKKNLYDLGKAFGNNLIYEATNNFEEAIALYQQYNNQNLKHINSTAYSDFVSLCKHFLKENKLLVRQVISSQKAVLSIVVLISDGKRFYNIINHTSAEGRKLKANFFLYDNLFREFADSPMLFDFEGSDLPGVKHFYKSFGAFNQPYYQWHFNLLPWPLSWLKR